MAALIKQLRFPHLARTAMTRAVVLEKVKEIKIRDIDISEPFGPRDVRIDIKSVGICGSDVHYYQVPFYFDELCSYDLKHGSIGPFILNQPMVLGHECSGVVTEVKRFPWRRHKHRLARTSII